MRILIGLKPASRNTYAHGTGNTMTIAGSVEAVYKPIPVIAPWPKTRNPDDYSMEQSHSARTTLEHITSEVRHILSRMEDKPVGAMTAYRNSILRLADAVDRLASEIDPRGKPHSGFPASSSSGALMNTGWSVSLDSQGSD